MSLPQDISQTTPQDKSQLGPRKRSSTAQKEDTIRQGVKLLSNVIEHGALDFSTERHYTTQEIAALWGVSDWTIRRIFEGEPGVLRLSRPRKLGKRTNKPQVTLRIPSSVASRLHQRESLPASSLPAILPSTPLKVQRHRR